MDDEILCPGRLLHRRREIGRRQQPRAQLGKGPREHESHGAVPADTAADLAAVPAPRVDDAAQAQKILEQGGRPPVQDHRAGAQEGVDRGVLAGETRGVRIVGAGQVRVRVRVRVHWRFHEAAIPQRLILTHAARRAGEFDPRGLAMQGAIGAAAPPLQHAFPHQTRLVERLPDHQH